jgi:hypothetical protein
MKLKHFLAVIVACLLLTTSTMSQVTSSSKNEIRLGYGVLTMPELANTLFSVFPAIGIEIARDTITDYICSAYGVASLEYTRAVAPWCRVGASLTVNPISTIMKTKKGFDLTYSYYVFSLMPRVDFCYVNKGIFSMYSGLQAGVGFIYFQDRQGNSTLTDQGVNFAYHVNAIGIRVGKEIGAYMEWGFGFRGIVNLGISGRF